MSLSPFAAAKLVNAKLALCGVTKPLPPQMFYNYTTARLRAGKAPLIACTPLVGGGVAIEEDDLQEWLVAYMSKKGYKLQTPTVEVDHAYLV